MSQPEKKKSPTTGELSKEVREKLKSLAQRINESLEGEDDGAPRLPQTAVVAIRR